MISKGDTVTIVTHHGVVFTGRVIAADDKTITLKIRRHGVVTINVSVIKEIEVIEKDRKVK
jgi:ribosome maturation factor RimP